MKIIDSNKSVFEISQQYPELVQILATLGFKDILLPGMLQSAGRMMTIRKGATMKKIDWSIIESTFSEKGFLIQ
jgi:hypothetical protein